LGQNLCRAFADAAAGSGDQYDLACNTWISTVCSSFTTLGSCLDEDVIGLDVTLLGPAVALP
jgi:hypothetical protein